MNLLKYVHLFIVATLCCLSSISSTFSSTFSADEKDDPESQLVLAAPKPMNDFGETIKLRYPMLFNGYSGNPVHAPGYTQQIKEIEDNFPGFRMIENHLACEGCVSPDDLREIETNSGALTSRDLLTLCETIGPAVYRSLFIKVGWF